MARGINLKFPLRAFRKGFFESNQDTLAAVREDIKTLLLTRKGERVVNPDIGTDISVFAGELFNNIDNVEMKVRIKAEIDVALATWMPHVKLVSIDLLTERDDPNVKTNQLQINMDYVLTNAEALGDSVQLNING
jgi:phage baseplate assembly protein W